MRKRKETPKQRAERRRRDERWAVEQQELRELAVRYDERIRRGRERRERRGRLLQSFFLLRRPS